MPDDDDALELFKKTLMVSKQGPPEILRKIGAFSILLANIHTCDKKNTVKDWKVGIEKGEYEPMGEDLFTEMCLTKTGVSTIRALLMFDTISTISSNVQVSITSNQRICALSKKSVTKCSNDH